MVDITRTKWVGVVKRRCGVRWNLHAPTRVRAFVFFYVADMCACVQIRTPSVSRECMYECTIYVCAYLPRYVRVKLCEQSADYIEKLSFEWKTRRRKMVWHKYNTAKMLKLFGVCSKYVIHSRM